MECFLLIFAANNRTPLIALRHRAFNSVRAALQDGNAVPGGWRHCGWEYSNDRSMMSVTDAEFDLRIWKLQARQRKKSVSHSKKNGWSFFKVFMHVAAP